MGSGSPLHRRRFGQLILGTATLGGLAGRATAANTEVISADRRDRLEQLYKNYPSAFPETYDQVRTKSVTLAETLRKACQEFSDLDSYKPESRIAESVVGHAKRVAAELDGALSIDVPVAYIDDAFTTASRVADFLPLLSNAQNLLEAARRLRSHPRSKKALETFHKNIILLLANLALLGSTAGYKTAFVGTRYVANYGLVRFRRYLGLRLYALGLSAIHWTFRFSASETTAYIVDETATVFTDFYLQHWRDFPNYTFATLEPQDLDYDFLDAAQPNSGSTSTGATGSEDGTDSGFFSGFSPF